MRQEELVGKKVLVKLRALPKEEQEQRVAKPVFDRFSIVEVIGFNYNNTRDVIIDGKSLGWSGSALCDTDIVMREAKTYWFVNLNDVVTVLE
jgi:hypothetical protein